MKKHRVFVYGTLRRGMRLHDWLREAKFIGETKTESGYALFALRGYGFPVMRYAETPKHKSRVVGEVFEVDDYTLEGLDHLERGYTRISVPLEDGSTALTYLMTRDHYADREVLVESGDWSDHPDSKIPQY